MYLWDVKKKASKQTQKKLQKTEQMFSRKAAERFFRRTTDNQLLSSRWKQNLSLKQVLMLPGYTPATL